MEETWAESSSATTKTQFQDGHEGKTKLVYLIQAEEEEADLKFVPT